MDEIICNFDIEKCMYCRRETDKNGWKSFWVEEQHYKSILCVCGKESWFKVNFLGSGHDALSQNIALSLESTIKKVSE